MTDISGNFNPPALIVYKEILPGDLRKLQALSNNDANAGGGARDLRVPKSAFGDVMRRIFSEGVTIKGKNVRVADVTYLDDSGQPQNTQLFYWPSTKARPSEERIAQINASPAIGGRPPRSDKGRVFLLLIKFADSTVRCEYAYEEQLKQNVWAPEVTQQILGCMAASDATSGRKSAMGFYDFFQATGYCHAK